MAFMVFSLYANGGRLALMPPVGVRLAGDGVLEIAIAGKPGSYKSG
jgi:hypothetical protein